MNGATSGSACAAPAAAAPLNATLFNAAGSCAAALTLYNTLYNATLDTKQQVIVVCCPGGLCTAGTLKQGGTRPGLGCEALRSCHSRDQPHNIPPARHA